MSKRVSTTNAPGQATRVDEPRAGPRALSFVELKRRAQEAPEGPAWPDHEPRPRSRWVRHLDAGSCNACELALGAMADAPYSSERYGVALVASPREADVLAVTGPLTEGMKLASARTYAAMPPPREVLLVGDCACGGGPFRGGDSVPGYELYDYLACAKDDLQVIGAVRGCPPSPAAILGALLFDDSPNAGGEGKESR